MPADLVGVFWKDLRGADLNGANLSEVNMHCANLGAIWERADRSNRNLQAVMSGGTIGSLPFRVSEKYKARKLPSKVSSPKAETIFQYDEGGDVYLESELPRLASRSGGLRILRSLADADGLRLVLEGLAGHAYTLPVRTPRELAADVTITPSVDRDAA